MSTQEHSYLNRLRADLVDRRISRRDFLRTATLLGMSAAAAYGFAGRASFAQEAVDPAILPKGGGIKIGMPVHAIDLPHAINWGEAANMLRPVLEYLTRTAADNITRPFLLESWQPSDDLKKWTLKLRPGITWRKGDRLTADHVIWNFQNVLDPKTGSSVVGLMQDYMLAEYDTGEKDEAGKLKKAYKIWDANAIEKIDDLTIVLNLKQPQLAVPEHLFHYPFMIVNPEDPKFSLDIDGTGAFRVAEFEASRRIKLEARENYWRPGFPRLQTVEFIDLGDDAGAAVAAITSGQVDALYDVGQDEALSIGSDGDIKIYDVTSAETLVVKMRADQKPFDDARIRMAMKLAVDSDLAMQVGLLGNGELAEHHHVCSVHPEYAKLPRMARDVERAKQLLAEAGYASGIDVELTAKNAPAKEGRVAEVLSQNWSEAGIRCKINMVPSAAYWDIWTDVPLGLTSWSHRPLGIMVLGLAYRTGVPWNETHYSNPKFDALLGKAEATPDVEARRKIMEEIEKLMQEDGPIAQPFWVKQLAAYHKRILNVQMHPSRYIFAEEMAVST